VRSIFSIYAQALGSCLCQFFPLTGAFLAMIFISSCANKVSPTGGAQDVIPPVETSASPPNFSVGFKSRSATITFNEFIQLKDLQKNLIVSPIMKPLPEVMVRRKSLVIKMPDTLLTNTTYTMNFGESIADIREGNVARNYQYVFSTGPVLDSLEVRGNVFYGENLKTEKDILVMLYADSITEDSIPYKILPSYFAKTDSSGNFHITNISPGAYRIIALKDADNNYLFNRTDETIGFRFSPVDVPDSAGVELAIFVEKPKLFLKRASLAYTGKVILAFSGPVNGLQLKPADGTVPGWQIIQQNENRDTAFLWMNNDADSVKAIISNHDMVIDTIAIRIKADPKKGSERGTALKKVVISNPVQNGILELGRPFVLSMSYPVTESDLRKIIVMEDSVIVQNPEFLYESDLKLSLKINIPFKQGRRYDMLIPEGTFTSYNGLVNDTVKISFSPKDETEYGSITLNLTAPDIGFDYVLMIVNDEDAVIRKEAVKPRSKTVFEYLDPGIYRVKVIYDGNANKKWDTGNYLEKLQPERVYYYKDPITVRSNWDLETEWVITR